MGNVNKFNWEKAMKTLPTLLICLVLSLTVAGQSYAMQATLPLDGINQVLQMKIEKDLARSLKLNSAYHREQQLDSPEMKEPATVQESEDFVAPDCFCNLHTRII